MSFRCIFLVIVIFLITGCSYSLPKHTLTIAIHDDPHSLSPEQGENAFNFSLSRILFATLFREEPSGLIPALASSYQPSENGLCYRFFIRKDAKWSDGSLLLAEDVVAAWTHTKKTGRYPELFDNLTFYAPSSSEVVVELKDPSSQLLAILASPFFSVYRPESPLLSSGPFMVHTYLQGETLVLHKNPHYYDDALVELQSIDFRIIPNIYTALHLLRRGDVDWVGQPWHQGIPFELRSASPFYAHYPVDGTFWLILNSKDPILSSLANRKRLVAAIRKEELVRYALGDQYKVVESPSPNEDERFCCYEDSSAQFPGKITLIYPNNITRCQRLAEVLQEQCRNAGINLVLQGLEYHVFVQKRAMQDFSISTATSITFHPLTCAQFDHTALNDFTCLPLYHMEYDYILGKPLDHVIHHPSGSVDLIYARFH
ncbi:peptide-binding protein [Chlamydia muridarum str. Nigg]|uniref:Peptide-binding protein n=2 Tax=Chlamydia muridarum TaxID=83560 RepID=A0A069ZU13_CHLMR|nr:ABC transporter substrate-binding protein [Chlamydia muridarum]UFT29166.1 peptide-binding protein [Chlamydia trachomatis]AAF39272.1 peptide ABC transporter, periplasmic peptide-binding protein, putative [Chlamydia muridarum str. Nigg]AHH22800.1 peptide-binding protein [Chlamydia muridarum str. Nigg3 CMUT3-5]AHH23725.1 peptide-binding protein [Chlamydia muridarum str. Nigg CM972]AID37939.1 peptide-binding protein [Chlamydia muridarum str. Nigg 2 MCR]